MNEDQPKVYKNIKSEQVHVSVETLKLHLKEFEEAITARNNWVERAAVSFTAMGGLYSIDYNQKYSIIMVIIWTGFAAIFGYLAFISLRDNHYKYKDVNAKSVCDNILGIENHENKLDKGSKETLNPPVV